MPEAATPADASQQHLPAAVDDLVSKLAKLDGCPVASGAFSSTVTGNFASSLSEGLARECIDRGEPLVALSIWRRRRGVHPLLAQWELAGTLEAM